MPCVIRKNLVDHVEEYATLAPAEWGLRDVVEALEQWLLHHRGELPPGEAWAADVGFAPRTGDPAGGPVISRNLMEMCLEVNLEIYLSER